ncbi:MAG: hypothetical protein Q9227_002318 [Pyrenula ochraceoflavens]
MASERSPPEPLSADHNHDSPRTSSWRRRNSLTARPRDYDQLPDREITEDADGLERHVTQSHDRRLTSSGSRSSYDRYGSKSPLRRPPRSPLTPQKPKKMLKFEPLGLPLDMHLRGVSAVKFSPDGTMFASCSADQTLMLWKLHPHPHHIHTFEGHLAGLSCLTWSPDSRMIATGSDDKCIRLWSTSPPKPHPNPLIGHHNYVYSIAFSPKGNMLASGSFDEAVFLWDVRSGRVMRSLPAHSDPVGGIDFSRDGTLVVSCAGDGLIRVWDTLTGQCLKTLVHEDRKGVTSVQFVPNSRYVLAWTLDSCIRLWDYAAGRCVKTYQGHENARYSLTGAVGRDRDDPKGAFVVSGSEDGSVVAWDVSSKEVLWRGEGAHEGPVMGVDVWSKEGERSWMVTCGLDKKVRVWREVGEDGKDEPMAEVNGLLSRGMELDGVAEDQVKVEPSVEEDTIMETVEEFQG